MKPTREQALEKLVELTGAPSAWLACIADAPSGYSEADSPCTSSYAARLIWSWLIWVATAGLDIEVESMGGILTAPHGTDIAAFGSDIQQLDTEQTAAIIGRLPCTNALDCLAWVIETCGATEPTRRLIRVGMVRTDCHFAPHLDFGVKLAGWPTPVRFRRGFQEAFLPEAGQLCIQAGLAGDIVASLSHYLRSALTAAASKRPANEMDLVTAYSPSLAIH